MRRGPLFWYLAALGGVIVLIVVTAIIGTRDDRDESVSAGQWAQSVCGAVGVWRGEVEAIVEDVRTPAATAAEEPQSETTQGRTGFIRAGLERAVQSAETLVEGVENAGVPETEQGEQTAQQVSAWSDSAQGDLEDAQDSLDEEAGSLEGSIDQLTSAARAVSSVLAGGLETLVEVGQSDPEAAAALRESSTCQELREEAAR